MFSHLYGLMAGRCLFTAIPQAIMRIHGDLALSKMQSSTTAHIAYQRTNYIRIEPWVQFPASATRCAQKPIRTLAPALKRLGNPSLNKLRILGGIGSVEIQASDIQADAATGEAWANSIVGFVMAFSAVLSALTALTNGRTTAARLENVAALAYWSRNYAGRVYHLTKTLGLLKTTPGAAPIGSSEVEDEILAESGLDSYAEALVKDDQP
jgi:hypothetical protein